MRNRVCCFLQAAFVWTVIASSIPDAALAQSNPPVDSLTQGNRISINVVVTDKKGQPIDGLQASDFAVFDNKESQKLLAFGAVGADTVRQDPVNVVIVVDMINSPFSAVASEREQIGEFLKQNDGILANPTSIAIFGESGVRVGRAFSRDGNALIASFAKQQSQMRVEGTSAGVYGEADHLRMSLNQLGELLSYEATVPGRKLILVIGPGWPLLSQVGFDTDMKHRTEVFKLIVQLTNGLRESHVALYCIDPLDLGKISAFYYQNFLKGVSVPKDAVYPKLALQVLAEHSGGQVLVSGPVILGGLNTALRDASTGYELTFEAARSDHAEEYHAIEVRVDRPNVIVRTTRGYYTEIKRLGQ